MTKKHLTFEERTMITQMLANRQSFKAIALAVNKNCSTISREIRNHMLYKKTGSYNQPFNSCLNRKTCIHSSLCKNCIHPKRQNRCRFCDQCNRNCPDYQEEKCKKLSSPPYVCNGCITRARCTLEKCFYNAAAADQEYRETLAETRSGISYTEDEIRHLDETVSPLIRQGQSIHHICANNKDSLMVSESTIYRLVDYNVFSARNIDLPRKVRYKTRKAAKNFKVDRSCRIGRTLTDFSLFQQQYPELPITQMDSVVGRKGGRVLLTIHFVKAEFMVAYLRDSNDSQSVIDVFDRLYIELRCDIFMKLFPVILTDNGSEFSNPAAIEFDRQGNQRTHIFYCDPSAPGQKGSAEKNHEFIRYVLPKGSSFDDLTQDDVSLLMDHINSYSRKSLGDKCPYEMMEFLYGRDVLDSLGCTRIPPNEVNLTPSLLRERAEHAAFSEARRSQDEKQQ